MTKKIFRSFMLSAVAVLLAGVVIVMTCLYSYFASVQESQLQAVSYTHLTLPTKLEV